MDCALVSAATAPSPSLLAINWSTYALICTTPRLTNTGAKLRNTSRTLAAAVSRLNRSLRVSASTTGNCTKNCKRAADHRAPGQIDRQSMVRSLPRKTTMVAIIATFQITGAV